LHTAAITGQKEIAEILIAHSATVNAKDKEGKTPLHWALDKGHRDVVEVLRQHGGTE
jgi:ankyrin repeat protein